MMTKLIATAARHASATGSLTAIPQLIIWSADAPKGPTPALFDPEFYILLQGAKRLTVAGRTFEFRAGTSALASVGLPFTSEVIEASSEQPYLGIEWKLDASVVASLLLDMPDHSSQLAGAISITQVDDSITEPLGRLVQLLDTPTDIRVLMLQFERELCYRLLQGPLGPRLRQLGHHNARFGQIKRAARWIGENADRPMSVEWLAAHVGMSVTSFHRHFRAVTTHTPLEYQRHIRLLDARRRLASGTASVTGTAFATGYASASQFSREYKRAFGITPIRDTALLRQ